MEKIEANFGPGTYFFGDPCYALNEQLYDSEWGGKHNWENGDYAPLFAVGSTKYGDGEYRDNTGHRYPVDSGSIGLTCIDDEAVRRDPIAALRDCGRVICAKQSAVFTADDGHFTLTIDGREFYEIYTDDEEEEEEEEEDWWGDAEEDEEEAE